MQYDKLYDKDYIVKAKDVSYLYCDISYFDEDYGGWYCLDERSYFDNELDLMESIFDNMKENGFDLDNDIIDRCIKTNHLETFFEEVHRVFTVAGIKHVIEFRELR